MSKRRFSNNFEKDFSNRTVVVMLIIVVLVSALSLGFYLNNLQAVSTAAVQKEQEPSNIGTVSIQIVEPPPEERQPSEKEGVTK